MTAPKVSTVALLDMAMSLGCVGVELRNDLGAAMFDGMHPADVGDEAGARNLRILALAEIYGFNDNTTETRAAALSLMGLARACGAEAIVLVPRVAGDIVDPHMQRASLRGALSDLQPMLEDTGVTALIEPLGFANSSLRLKADAVAVLDAMGQPACFALVHDTFHHALSGETAVFADATRIVHVSGVADPNVAIADMTDAHRGLVDKEDRLGNIAQIIKLRAQGYTGPFSYEAFAPSIHNLIDPTTALSASTAFINSKLADLAA